MKKVVTREFTGGILKGQTHTEVTSVPFRVGQVVDNPVGGSPYRIISVEGLEENWLGTELLQSLDSYLEIQKNKAH